MIILWSLLLTAAASAHKVVDSVEDIGPEAFANVTTLYPVANQNSHNNTQDTSKNNTENRNTENNNTITTTNDETDNKDNKDETDNKTKQQQKAASWKIEAAYAESNLDKENATAAPVVKQKNEAKEFKPSQHLGSFLDGEVAPTRETFDSFTPAIKKPASGFVSSKEVYHNKIPKELIHTHKEYPYKFESSIYTRAKDNWRPDRHKPWPTATTGLEGLGFQPGKWGTGSSSIDSLERPGKVHGFEGFGGQPGKNWGNTGLDFGYRPKGWLDSLEPKPTVESVNVPAGGLYKYTDPFKEKPGNDGDFGLEFNNDVKETALKKRENPWEGILRMLTAFIPVGIIISALTPSIITIENVADNSYPSNMFRRADAGSSLPAISERCRRRLLCELHNDKNYNYSESTSPRKWKQCFRIRCEDPAALAKTLEWLLERQTNRQHHH